MKRAIDCFCKMVRRVDRNCKKLDHLSDKRLKGQMSGQKLQKIRPSV